MPDVVLSVQRLHTLVIAKVDAALDSQHIVFDVNIHVLLLDTENLHNNGQSIVSLVKQCRITVALLLACSGLAACTDAPSQPAPVFLNGGLGNTATRSAAAKRIPPESRFVIVGTGQLLG